MHLLISSRVPASVARSSHERAIFPGEEAIKPETAVPRTRTISETRKASVSKQQLTSAAGHFWPTYPCCGSAIFRLLLSLRLRRRTRAATGRASLVGGETARDYYDDCFATLSGSALPRQGSDASCPAP